MFWNPPVFWNSPAYRVPLEIAAMAVVAALAFWIASSALRSEIKDLQLQLDQQRQANTELEQQADDARNQVAALRQENERLQQQYVEQQSTDVALNDGGGLIMLDRQGKLSGPEPVIANQAAVKRALATANVNVAQNLTELTGKAGKLMGGRSQSAYGLISPVGVVLINDRPTFRWLAQPGATGYEVALFDPASKKVADSGLITATNWTADRLLERGVIYSWQVRAIRDGKEIILPPPEAPDARFKILERAKADELERAQRSSPRSHLLLGILYAEAGMVEEAEQQFRDLVKANPESEVAKKLLSSIRKRAAGR
jgi:TolA-binding protein